MINMPNAAGFIPSESILDGITKLFNTFGGDATKLRAAQLANLQGQTAHAGALTTAVPLQTANDTTRALNDTTRANEEPLRTGIEQQNADRLKQRENFFEDTQTPQQQTNWEQQFSEEQKRNNLLEQDKQQAFQAEQSQKAAEMGQRNTQMQLESGNLPGSVQRSLDLRDKQEKDRTDRENLELLLKTLNVPVETLPAPQREVYYQIWRHGSHEAAAAVIQKLEAQRTARTQLKGGKFSPKPPGYSTPPLPQFSPDSTNPEGLIGH